MRGEAAPKIDGDDLAMTQPILLAATTCLLLSTAYGLAWRRRLPAYLAGWCRVPGSPLATSDRAA
jgi:hypothetical protein